MTEKPKRVKAILEELNAAANDYIQSKDWFQEYQVRFEAAREKLAGILQLAATMMPAYDLFEWQKNNTNVKYVGMSIGDSIIVTLQSRAYDVAVRHVRKKTEIFFPWTTKDGIVTELESGGFDFRSTAPLREVHAALIHLDGVTEDASKSLYKATNADELLERVRTHTEPEEEEAEIPFE